MLNFFSLWHLELMLFRPNDFLALRRDVWYLDDEAYAQSFQTQHNVPPPRPEEDQRASSLVPMGTLGYSGSTFFKTSDGKFLIKSLDRHFEHQFFMHELLTPYIIHMWENPGSLLVRITDLLYVPYPTLGGLLGIEPTHHVVMEHLLYGIETDGDAARYETYDLKPDDYFFPERDIANGKLAPQSIKNRLVDQFPDRIHVSQQATEELLALLNTDTEFLADSNVVDYSLFLVRYARSGESRFDASDPFSPETSTADRRANSWRMGVVSADGQWVYRAVLLDFFWARHKLRAKAMAGLVATFNTWAGHGPMTITTEPFEYRRRFMRMVQKLVGENGVEEEHDAERSADC
ncbi:SAICAR synthase-like protein [Trichoderma citrinoviride]|uniref:SAICAR synthase-like protein n=1 Tax=Trichoderma citrinoviride TaxID=58853 RepID=A0A2T4BBR0_9HYPO|nr:SAICAR synthase-like protein [Trichoderma citrinoviride]PTB66629.1 SAICAR synthase-like protein [Trichoderma citrinoviride]